jgi:hypothetical protein
VVEVTFGRSYHSTAVSYKCICTSENLIALYFRNLLGLRGTTSGARKHREKNHNFRRLVPLTPTVTPFRFTLSTKLDKVCLLPPWDARSTARA